MDKKFGIHTTGIYLGGGLMIYEETVNSVISALAREMTDPCGLTLGNTLYERLVPWSPFDGVKYD